MDTKLQNDIMESIKKNLPEQVAGQLKVVLEEYEELKKVRSEKIDLSRQLERLFSDKHDLEAKISKYQTRENELADWEKAVQERENKAEINELKILLKASDTVNERVMGFVDALMRNTTYRKDAFPHTLSENLYTENGNYFTKTVVIGEDTNTTAE